MPIHDWTRVPPGLWHNFHLMWTGLLTAGLNDGRMGGEFVALAEQKVRGVEPDAIAVALGSRPGAAGAGGTATLDAPRAAPRARIVTRFESETAGYARQANRVAVRHHLGRLVAVIELVSPGNKDSREAFKAFLDKLLDFLQVGVHVMVIDLFPPTPRDPHGLYAALNDQLGGEPADLPAGSPLTAVSFDAGEKTAHIEPLAVGDPLPDLPLFLGYERFVAAPLESSYAATWAVTPAAIRDLVQPPAGP